MALAIPATKSPASVSRMAFVIANPGTNSIIDPIIIFSGSSPKPIKLNKIPKPETSAPPERLIKKSFIEYLPAHRTKYLTTIPIKKAEIPSRILPPYIIAKEPAAIPAKRTLIQK